jgi:hypothetical protein
MTEYFMRAERDARFWHRTLVRFVVSRRAAECLAEDVGLPPPSIYDHEFIVLGRPATIDDEALDGFGIVLQ